MLHLLLLLLVVVLLHHLLLVDEDGHVPPLGQVERSGGGRPQGTESGGGAGEVPEADDDLDVDDDGAKPEPVDEEGIRRRMFMVGWTGVGMLSVDILEVGLGLPSSLMFTVSPLSSPTVAPPIGEEDSPRRFRQEDGAPAAEEDEEAGRLMISPDHHRWK